MEKANRKPIRRQKAETYLLITLLSFAVSISITRLFLRLTNYPKLGGGEIHIAHVLWGGLFLFIASLLPLIFANRWTYFYSAAIAGLGVGLFIDEVGKFITSSNDYFYPAAAPIVYAIFLLTLLVYNRIKKPRAFNVRTELYYVFEEMEEVLDHDLSSFEKERLDKRLEKIKSNTIHPDVKRLADILHDYLSHPEMAVVPEKPSQFFSFIAVSRERLRCWLSRSWLRAILAIGLASWGIWSLYIPFILFFSSDSPQRMTEILTHLLQRGMIHDYHGLPWFEARLAVESGIGVVFLAAACLFALRKDRHAVDISYAALILSLTVVNLLIFYFDQFSTIINAVLQLILFIGVISYRDRFLEKIE